MEGRGSSCFDQTAQAESDKIAQKCMSSLCGGHPHLHDFGTIQIHAASCALLSTSTTVTSQQGQKIVISRAKHRHNENHQMLFVSLRLHGENYKAGGSAVLPHCSKNPAGLSGPPRAARQATKMTPPRPQKRGGNNATRETCLLGLQWSGSPEPEPSPEEPKLLKKPGSTGN